MHFEDDKNKIDIKPLTFSRRKDKMGIQNFIPNKLREYSMDDQKREKEEEPNKEPIQKHETTFWKAIYFVFQACKIYFLWVVLHYAASQYYLHYCAPSTLYGFMMSPFLVSLPHCRAMRFMIYNGGNTIETMWFVVGTWVSAKLIVK